MRDKLRAIYDILVSKSFLYGTRQNETKGRSGVVWRKSDFAGLLFSLSEVRKRAEESFPDEFATIMVKTEAKKNKSKDKSIKNKSIKNKRKRKGTKKK